MNFIFMNRTRRGPDPYLEWRVRLFFAAGGSALVGMAVNSRILVGVAIALLAVAMGLRLAGGASHPEDQPGPSPEDDGGAEDDFTAS